MVIAALLAILFLALHLPAQTNAPRDLTSRYLFIVDTSAAMSRCAPAVQKTVANLLRSSMSAQLRSGDTVGVWTFDEELHAGRLPLQRWSPELTDSVASNTVAFLQAQRLQGKSRYEVIAPELQRIVQESGKLTVLLVTDGDEKISGTPFDSEIQSSIAQHFKLQRKARMPFIIVLRAWRGQFIHATVNLAPWPVEFPAFPPEPKIVEAPKPLPPEPKPAPRPVVPSLIVIGEKTISPPAPTAPAPSSTNLAALAPVPAPLNPIEIKPTPAPIPAPTLNEPATQAATPSTKNPGPAAPPAALPETRPPTEPTKPSPTVAGETKPAPTPVNRQPAEPAHAPPAHSPVVPAPISPSPAAPLRIVVDSPVNERTITNPPVRVALAVQPEPGLSRLGMVGIGIAVTLLAGGFFFALHRRARHAAPASLITRSLDRDRK